jgi:hypothetical protein
MRRHRLTLVSALVTGLALVAGPASLPAGAQSSAGTPDAAALGANGARLDAMTIPTAGVMIGGS